MTISQAIQQCLNTLRDYAHQEEQHTIWWTPGGQCNPAKKALEDLDQALAQAVKQAPETHTTRMGRE